MLASVCHEVSNPLAAVSSMLQILQSKRGVTPETMEKGLASIEANIARVLAITKKLGDYSRVRGEPAAVAIDGVVQAAETLLRHSGCGQTVDVDYRGAPGATVRSRPGELEQVVFNIFLNAAQAMQGAGRIDVATTRENGHLTFSVRDTGPGIAEEHLPRVFDPFFTTKPPGEGTGLGLAISYEIVQEIGGTIRATNHPDGGACFELVLPAMKARILLIDDDPGLSEVILMLLERDGYAAQHAATVKAGIARVEAANPDLVVTDLKLPDGTGLDAIAAIRARHAALPIIMITSYSSLESAIGALRGGAVDYVIKPFKNDESPGRDRARVERAAPRAHAPACDRGLHPRRGRALPGFLQREGARAHARHRAQGVVDAPPPVGSEARPEKRFLGKHLHSGGALAIQAFS